MKKLLATLSLAACAAFTASAATINLANVTADTTLNNGDVAYGTLGGNYKVSIADGATVTISNAVINGVDNNNYPWAGLTCLGDAEIVLKGNSSVMGFYENYPGIHVPVGSTLTIQGDGMLWVSSNGYGAGIGGGDDIPCGSIVITGGTISAPGGNKAAGIGGGRNSACGNIAISGGTIDATGGSDAAGIGSGFNGSCGTITIGMNGSVPPAIRVTATQGVVAWGSGYTVAPIGAGASGTCAGVSVASFLYDDHESPTRTIMLWDGDLATLTSDATAQDGTVIHGELHAYVKVSIAAGARVTISNVTIEGPRSRDYQWAGLTCLGDAEIVLVGTNTVIGAYGHHPGIFVPAGSTLTISGSGVLTTSSHGQGAGIGGGYGISCGNIVINGGTITATGGDGAAGIGGGLSDGVPYAECGDITINGGTVTATGGHRAAGIGGGYAGGCSNIVVGTGISQVVATCGDDCNNPIGLGYLPLDVNACTVTVDGSLIDYTVDSTRTLMHPPVIGGYAWNFTVVDGEARIIPFGDGLPATSPAPSGNLEIPSVLGGCPVTVIGNAAFVTCGDITSVTIPDGVTTIGGDAFYACSSLATVTIPASVTTISSRAFRFTGLGTAYVGEGKTASVKAMLLSSGHDQSFVDGITFIETTFVEPWDGNLAEVYRDTTVTDDTTLYGTLAGNYKISIAAGATVVLSNAVINGVNDSACPWAGLTCLGDAQIILAPNSGNVVKGFFNEYPGIYVPVGSTLTIGGSGSLNASSNGNGAGIGAGFGYRSPSGDPYPCGNIRIEGGTITATGSNRCAGIGGGNAGSTCGDIEILGGTVTATGGDYAAGIGGGDAGTCGDITIGVSVTWVVSTVGAGYGTHQPIGQGDGGTCGTITVDSSLSDTTSADGLTRTIVPPPVWNGDLATLTGDVTVESDMTIYGELAGQYKISIADGVTVTLDGAAITNGMDSSDYPWAGLTCLGDAEIVLAAGSANFVKGFYKNYPGIYVPENKTLTISGSGSLDASSNGRGAGIGAGYEIDCGDIVIESGTINATGGFGGAAIGGAYYANCGEVTINGGTITAIAGNQAAAIGGGRDRTCEGVTINGGTVLATGDGAAGIGTGYQGTCGAISITGGDVTATGGDFSAGIGGGNTGSCGDITITGGTVSATGQDSSAGIGGGSNGGGCGDITIGVGIVRVVATSGSAGADPIGNGTGSQASCGTVTVDPSLTDDHGDPTRTITSASTPPPVWNGDLATLTGDVTIESDMTLYGTLAGQYKISIADGVTVTLDGADITCGQNGEGYAWAGLTCLGDAEIVLAAGSANFVKGFYEVYPGIFVPAGSTLTIGGSGSLDAGSNGDGAGIGGGYRMDCGSIVIEGGVITATGGYESAGIGTGSDAACGTITITGGQVTATGGSYAAGIGTGDYTSSCGAITITGGSVTATGGTKGSGIGSADDSSSCGAITIGTDIVRVVASSGSAGADPIGKGAGSQASCGTVTVDPGLTDDHGDPTRTITSASTPPPPVWDGNLATLTGNVTVESDMTIYGELAGQYKISIADGVTVTLDGAAITNGMDASDYSWAGLTCLGDAEIVLAAGSANFVKGFYKNYPGIYVPENKTLTISGSGSLDARSNGQGAGIGAGSRTACGNIVINGGRIAATGGTGAAGIGSGRSCACGNIMVAGGSVTATGGNYAAGIGTGDFTSQCGDITITGGSVTATGGRNGAGIGSGDDSSSCGTITIGVGIVRVVATRGGASAEPVGKGGGNQASCGTVTVDPSLSQATSADGNTRTIIGASVWDGNLATLSGDATALEGTVIHGTLSGNYKITIADGAKVTLDGATIDGEDDENYPWAGLTCEGDAEIVLAPGSENFIEGFYGDYPGIHVPAGHTLTISGSGSLDAGSNGLGAGIGGGFDLPCGSIVIEGGTISATGATGIGGSDMGSCDDITINGGNVTAIAIGGAGIGGGDGSSCGDIAINGGTVVAVGAVCGAGIGGGGNDSSCGTITIAGGITTATGGGSGAAGIGAGACDPELDTSTCGDITIGADIVRVVAKRGSGGNGNECIGAGEGSAPVRVTVDPGLADDHGSQTRMIAYAWDGNLATLTRNVTIASDMTIYGELAGQYKISIAAGATVTLDNAVVTNGVDSSDYPWAGLTCLGDAEIVLAAGSENFVKGFYEDHPGIHVPAGSTLTISGSGSLDASSNGCGAGIGGGYQLDCGNIVINGGRIAATGGIGAAGIGSGRGCTCGSITIAGGSVTATGGDYAAGIGTGDFTSSCGDITITGGSVTATGGRNGAGIGSGDDSSSCGTITIGADIVRVEATRGDENAEPIGKGAGSSASCGTVTVDSSLTDDNGSPTRTITGGGSGSGYAAWATENGVSGAWNATDANGVANVFRYAFDKPTGAFTDPPMLDITFNAVGKAVVKTPPLVNTTGFTFTIGASDNVDGTGNAASYPLNASGETVIDETGKTTRFFRLRAVTQ